MRSLLVCAILLSTIALSGLRVAECAEDVCRHVLIPSVDSVSVFIVCESGRTETLPIRLPQNRGGTVGRGSLEPTLSPDDRRVAFTRDRNIVLLDLAEGAETVVTRLPEDTSSPAGYTAYITSGAPDSQRLMYCVVPRRGYHFDLAPGPSSGFFIYDIQSGASERIRLPGIFECWVRDDEIVVSGEVPDDLISIVPIPSGDLYLSNLRDSTLAHRLTSCCDSTRVSSFHQIVPSPDGFEIAIHFRPSPDSAQVVRLDLDTGTILPVTEVGFGTAYQWPAYSPDGRHLVFRAERGVLQVDERRVFECTEGVSPDHFAWISDRTLAIVCGDSLRVLGVETGTELGAAPCNRSHR